MNNRELQRKNSRRTMSRKRGGGYGMGAPLVNIPSGPGSDWNFAVKQPINQGFDDCLFPARPGQLFNTPQPSVAQAGWPTLGGAGGGMMGGKRSRRHRRRRYFPQRGAGLRAEEIVAGTEFYLHRNGETKKYRITAINPEGAGEGYVRITRLDAEETVDVPRDLLTLGVAALQEEEVAAHLAHVIATMPAGRPQLMRGGAYDSEEVSHAYRSNGWDQTLSHGASTATAWGRDTGLVQTVMAGGRRRRIKGGAIDPIEASHGYPPNGWETPSTHGAPVPIWGPKTGLAQESMAGGRRRRRGSRKQRGGGCGCTGSKMFGGSRRTRRMRGGANYGYAIDPSQSIGGSGPNVDAVRTGVPCDPRPGILSSGNPQLPADPRAYGVGYSATPNTTTPSLQAGGAYSTGNAFPDSCYKAPGSELPVYNAQTAGFNFYPSTASNGALPDGVTPYNDVVPYAARMGGARRSRKHRKGSKGRKHRKD